MGDLISSGLCEGLAAGADILLRGLADVLQAAIRWQWQLLGSWFISKSFRAHDDRWHQPGGSYKSQCTRLTGIGCHSLRGYR